MFLLKRFSIFTIFLNSGLLFLMNCNSQQNTTKLNYTDQNNNTYFITETTLSYLPIKKRNSSSGVYDGGEKKEITLTTSQFIEINQLANQLFKDTTLHTDKRKMRTSILSSKNNTSFLKVILIPSEKRIFFEKSLKSYLNK